MFALRNSPAPCLATSSDDRQSLPGKSLHKLPPVTDASTAPAPLRPHIIFLNGWHRVVRTDLPPAAASEFSSFSGGWKRFLLGHRRRHWRAGLFRIIDTYALPGVILCETGAADEAPSPFDEPFEPLVLGLKDPGLQTLTSPQPTREERTQAIGMVISVGICVAVAAFLAWLFATRPSAGLRLAWIPPALIGMLLLIQFLRRTRATMAPWLIVPGAVFVRPLWKRGDDNLRRFTPADTIPYLSKRHAKNHVFYVLELWTRDRIWSRVVTQRELLAFLAAWRIQLAPPPIEKMQELAA
jgi:hypothetical protein